MAFYPSSGNFSTPQQRRPSDPTWSTPKPSPNVFTPSRSLQTPRSGNKKKSYSRARGTPFMTPDRVRITLPSGQTCPMEVFKPKDYFAQRKGASPTPLPMTPTSSTNTPGRARPPGSKRKTLLFPRSPSPSPLSKLVSPPMQGTPRREPVGRPRDPMRPTVQLLRVLNKCWSDDASKEASWSLTDGLLNGRNDERDKSGMWNTLGGAVRQVWPELSNWIMCNTPAPNEDEWFSTAKDVGPGDIACVYDPVLDTKDSSLDRVGFHMTPSAYNTACRLIKVLAKPSPPRIPFERLPPWEHVDLKSLVDSKINPFFVIYACADCDIPLPSNFNRELLWKHLDAILRAKCWRGLGSARATMQDHTSADADYAPPKNFRRKEDDPGDILYTLLNLSNLFKESQIDPAYVAVDVPQVVHALQITIKDYKWAAEAQVGTVWYEAGDLYDEDDIACFAVIDSLTRLLPSCKGDILEISTGDIRLLWGVGGATSGAWPVVHAACKLHRVKLRGKFHRTAFRAKDPWARIDPTEINVPPRDREVVDLVVNEFMQRELDGKGAYRCMVEHLLRATT